MRKYKKKNKIFLLAILVLVVSIGYALLSTTLNINGIAGINKNAFDIHWDRDSVAVTDGSIEGNVPTVSGDNDSIVEFTTELELPGDFYEFTVDAINEGTIDGVVTLSDKTTYKLVNEEYVEQALPSYIKYSVTYEDGTTLPKIGDVLVADGGTQKYKVRVEYDSEATTLPAEPETYKFEYEVKYEQYKEDANSPLDITFNPNGGTVDTTSKKVERGETVGELPLPEKNGVPFEGWYTDIDAGHKISVDEMPERNTTYYAHWADSYTIFNTGKNVNFDIKTLVGDNPSGDTPWFVEDNYVYGFYRSETAPDSSYTTINLASEGEIPIYAWYTNNNIYWYTEATNVFLNEDASYMFSSFKSLSNIDTSFKTSNTTNMSFMFTLTSALSSINLNNFDTSNVTIMRNMFSGTGIRELDLTSFNTSKVTDMSGMFATSRCSVINLSSFDTSKVTDMSSMFASSSITSIDLSSFKTTSLINMSTMFAATSLETLDLSNFDTSHVTNFGGIFGGSSSLKILNLNNWDFSSVTNIGGIFSGINSVEEIYLYNVNTSSITSLSYLFSGLSRLKEIDLSDFDVSNCTSFSNMFGGCSSIKTIILDNWDFSSATDLTAMFAGVSSVETISFENVNTHNIQYMTAMFNNCSGIRRLNLESFDTSNVIDMNSMFYGMSNLNTISVSDNFVVDQVTNSSNMFYNDSSLVGGMGTKYNYSKTDKEYAHYDGGVSNPGYFNRGNPLYYKIDLNPNGGFVSPKSVSVTKTLAIGDIPTPTKRNYTFDGWYTEITGGILVDENYIPTGNQTIYAHWTPIPTYTVTFNANSGTLTEKTRKVTVGDTIGTLPVPIRDGYAFNGWYYPDSLTGIKVYASYIPNSDITIKADWIEIQAQFDTGPKFNEKIKRLVGDEPTPEYPDWVAVTDTKVERIIKSPIEPTEENKTESNIVSAPNSSVPIYIWFNENDGTLYWWTEANVAFTAPDASYMFAQFDGITELSFESINTSQTYDMSDMFHSDENLRYLDVSTFNTSRVTNVTSFVSHSSNLERINMSNWDLRNIQQMGSFAAVLSLTDSSNTLKRIDFDNVIFKKDMHETFAYLKNVETISLNNVDTRETINMEEIFYGDNSVLELDLSSFDTRNVTNMMGMFSNCYVLKNVDVSSFDTSNVTTMYSMFRHTSLEKLDLSHFKTDKVNNLGAMFDFSDNIEELNLSNWNFDNFVSQSGWGTSNLMGKIGVTRNVKKLTLDNIKLPIYAGSLFYYLTNLEELSLKDVDTSNIVDMGNMFNGCSKLEELDISSFDTSSVTVMSAMFSGMTNLKTIKVSKKFTTDRVGDSTGMFNEDTKLVGGNGTTYDTNHKDKEYARIDTNDTPGYFTLKTPASNFGNLTSSIRNTANKIANIKE